MPAWLFECIETPRPNVRQCAAWLSGLLLVLGPNHGDVRNVRRQIDTIRECCGGNAVVFPEECGGFLIEQDADSRRSQRLPEGAQSWNGAGLVGVGENSDDHGEER